MLLEILRRWDMAPGRPRPRARHPRRGRRGARPRRGEADAILTSGGASAGDEDHVSALLKRRGALDAWRIAVKPGRPLALGRWAGPAGLRPARQPGRGLRLHAGLRTPGAVAPRRRPLARPAGLHAPGRLREATSAPAAASTCAARLDGNGRGGGFRVRGLGAHFRPCLGSRIGRTGGRAAHDPSGRSGPLPAVPDFGL